ncbi:MAG: D-alanyl-D-alanine carboxypeptidase family protein [Caulobacteraceae bacterium]
MHALARRAAALVLATACLCATLAGGANAQPYYRAVGEPKFTAIVMDARTGEILYGARADSPRYPASVTKVMNLYLAFEALAAGRIHLSDPVLISPHAAAQPPTKLGLRAGETIRLEDAMHAMCVHSANDMAVAVAEKIGGTEARYAAMMTAKARQLGMRNSYFVNANGLPDNRQLTTAHDLAILARAVLRDFPQYYNFFSQQEYTYRGHTYVNTNHLLGKMPGVDGLKTGFTNAAGFNLAASAVRNGNRLIAVVMGSSSGQVRNATVENLLLTGFDVEERRARGERLLYAQNLFEQGEVAGPSAYAHYGPAASAAQGDGEDDAIAAVLSRAARPPPLAAPAKAPRPMARNWWVQVGQFHSHREATVQVEGMSRRFATLFDEAEGSVAGRRGVYLAKFAGLSETAARDACSTVRSRGLPCEARGPA